MHTFHDFIATKAFPSCEFLEVFRHLRLKFEKVRCGLGVCGCGLGVCGCRVGAGKISQILAGARRSGQKFQHAQDSSKYFAFTEATNSNCNVKFLACFQRSPQQQLQCVSTFLSKGPHHHLQ